MKSTFALLFAFAFTVPSLAADKPAWIGYGGPEGSRVFADQHPPTKFDHSKGEGVLWETPLPVWGHGSPIALKDRVFVMCETGPNNIFPLLICLDGKTGKILWQREVDHLPAIAADKARQDALRAEIKAYFEGESKLAGSRKGPSGSKAQNKKGDELFEKMGLMRDKFRRNQYSSAYACMGEAYATPVSDGEHVYVATLWGGFACFDFDGNCKWIAYSPGHEWNWLTPGRSPILYKNMLIHNGGQRMRAFDKATGKLLWSHEEKSYTIASPAVITIEKQDVLLAAGPTAYLLPEGKPLKIEGWESTGMQILVNPQQRDVAYFCGSGEHCGWENKGNAPIQPPAAFRFSLNSSKDTLTGKVLWHGGDLGGKKAWGGNAPWMVVHKGKFYHRDGAILDALSGKTLVGKFGDRWNYAVPKTNHLLQIAGDHVYGLDSSRGKGDGPAAKMEVFTLDGKKVAENILVRSPLTDEQKAMHKWATGDPEVWMTGRKQYFSYGWTFTFGNDRIYIRSMESLICIGKK